MNLLKLNYNRCCVLLFFLKVLFVQLFKPLNFFFKAKRIIFWLYILRNNKKLSNFLSCYMDLFIVFQIISLYFWHTKPHLSAPEPSPISINFTLELECMSRKSPWLRVFLEHINICTLLLCMSANKMFPDRKKHLF